MTTRTIGVRWILVGFLVPMMLVAQDRKMMPDQFFDLKDLNLSQSSTSKQYPLDAPVDPDTYVVGGGDRMNVQIETVPPLVFGLMVGVDGNLLIPTVGQVRVGGLTLRAAEEAIRKRVQGVNRTTAVSIGLTSARRIMVRTAGTALIHQAFEVNASDRVSTIVQNPLIVRSQTPVVKEDELRNVEPVPLARRSILLRRATGELLPVDLDLFYASGDSKWNPHVSEGDEIVANMLDENSPSVAIGGAVWVPGEYEFVDGDQIAHLTRFARGLRPFGAFDSVVLARVGEPNRIVRLGTADTLIRLYPGDRLWVPFRRSMQQADIVTVSGEVNMPGTYPLLKGSTRLTDILTMTGGMTQRAMIHGATLHRMKVSQESLSERLLLAQRGNMAVDDTAYVRQEELLRMMGERVNVDFRKAVASPGSELDPLLEPGDRITVPRRTGTVYVFGQVTAPGHLPYTQGWTFDDYLSKAGGMTDGAKSGDVAVIKFATQQWVDPSDTSIEEGDAIWVPKKIEQSFAMELMAYSQIIGIVSSVATIVLVLTQLLK